MDALREFFDSLGLNKEQRSLIMRVGWVSAVSGHILWVWGALSVMGLPSPYARADAVQQLSQDVQSDRAERLEHEILTLRQDQCKAQHDGNHAAVQLYADRLNELVGKYYAITHREARIPYCSEV